MLTETAAKARKLADLPTVQSDSLLALIALANADPRPDKIDVGVGVYRDAEGRTPILKVTKEAEKRLLETQTTKAYLGGAGDKRFAELLRPIVLGEHADDERIHGLQTPGGCGALRLGFELIAGANPNARVFIGTPTWPNHPPIVHAVGLATIEYPYYERGQAVIRFEDMLEALGTGEPGDVALLHGCCHNPTGADLSDEQWDAVTRIVVERGLIPFVDLAYQGFGRGLDEDSYGVRGILRACDEVIVAQSCDKNFSCYRDRVGSLFVKTGSVETTATAMAHVLQRAREMWSMPPIMAPRRCTSSSTIPSCAPAGWSSSTRCASASIRCVSASLRPTRASPSSAASSACSRCCRSVRSKCSSCARTMRSTWPTAAASTSSG